MRLTNQCDKLGWLTIGQGLFFPSNSEDHDPSKAQQKVAHHHDL